MPIVDIDWLREHATVPSDLTVEKLSRRLVRVGFEEEAIHPSSIQGPLVVGYVKQCLEEPQKSGKIIHWNQIDVGDRHNPVDENGNKAPLGIVCGAPNIAQGEYVVVALNGAVLPNNFAITPQKKYGHVSNGMCCSDRELGISNEYDGIILLKDRLTPEQMATIRPGDDAIPLLGLDVPELEINITPDRGYALSCRGIAREYSYAFGETFTDPLDALNAAAPKTAKDTEGEVEARIDDAAPIHGVPGCDHYYLRTIRGIDASAVTPDVVLRRLVRSGFPVSNLTADALNYVMLDLGEPMNAYDLDKVSAPLVVRRAHAGEKLTTVDGIERELDPEDLVVADSPGGEDGSRAIALAGVMIGKNAAATAETTDLLLESAHYDAVTVARTARRHKLPTEASHRFERGTDTQMQAGAAQLAVELITKQAGGDASGAPTNLDTTVAPKAIALRTTEVKRLAGLDVDPERIAALLRAIGCEVSGGEDGVFAVVPPTWRPDITQACDLVEEVARLVGYDEIPTRMPAVPATRTGLTLDQQRQRWVSQTLAESGLVETLSYPYVGAADFKAFGVDQSKAAARSVEIVNPLMGDRPWLRANVLLTLAGTLRRNIGRGLENVQIYEVGRVFHLDPAAPAIPALPGALKPDEESLAALDAGLPAQPLHVAGLLTGQAIVDGWYHSGRAVDWTDGIASAERVAARLGTSFRRVALKEDSELPQGLFAESWHPGRTAVLLMRDGTPVGLAGELHPRVIANLGIPEHSAAFELDLTAVFERLSTKPLQSRRLSSFPPVKQDLAFIVDESVTNAQLSDAIRAGAGEYLESIALFDVYHGDDLGEGKKSLAYSVVFRAPNKTLKSKDAAAIRANIVAEASRIGAQLRS